MGQTLLNMLGLDSEGEVRTTVMDSEVIYMAFEVHQRYKYFLCLENSFLRSAIVELEPNHALRLSFSILVLRCINSGVFGGNGHINTKL